MARVITFSRFYPKHHPLKGQQTYFVDKIWKAVGQPSIEIMANYYDKCNFPDLTSLHKEVEPKWHTIRKGERWKIGDKFSPRVWGMDINPKSGKSGPYQRQVLQTYFIKIKRGQYANSSEQI